MNGKQPQTLQTIEQPSRDSSFLINPLFGVVTPYKPTLEDPHKWQWLNGVGAGPPERSVSWALMKATTQGIDDRLLAELQDRFVELKLDRECPDEWRPSDCAYWKAVRTLSEAYTLLKATVPQYGRIPLPTLTTDEEGAVRCRWAFDAREVRANFAGCPNLRSYIYFEKEPAYDTEDLTSDRLARRLGWLLEK